MMGIQLTPVVKILLLLNVGIFAVANITNFNAVNDFMALRYFGSPNFQVYQIITHMFMHADIMHLFSNMFALFMFGPALESKWGPKRFMTFYLVCGIGASLLYTGVNAFELSNLKNKIESYNQSPTPYTYELILYREFDTFRRDPRLAYYYGDMVRDYEKNPGNPTLIEQSKEVLDAFYNIKMNIPMIGASGAIFGILLGFGMLFPNTILMLMFPPIPLKAKYFVAIYGLLELYAGVHQASGDTVAHFAHIGGMIFGYLMIVYWRKRRDVFY